jgi:hypothetical protein
MVNLKNICNSKPSGPKSLIKNYLSEVNISINPKGTSRKFYMFGKLQHQVYGTGYHCMKKKHILTTSMSFFGEKYESLRTENVKLSRDECFLMVMNKQCDGIQMDCDNEYCSYNSNPMAIFNWMTTRTNTTYSCTTSPKLITANTLNDIIFDAKCKVSDRQCYVQDSIIVWDATIYHECPLYLISQESFTVQPNSDILVSNNTIALQAYETKTICGLKMLNTLEGIFVSTNTNDKIAKNVTGGANIDEMKELLIAESDFRSVKDTEEKNDLLIRECFDFKTILNVFSRLEDRFLTHYLSDGRKITLYTTMGTVYKVSCKKILEIEIPLVSYSNKNQSMCFQDQPIKFVEDNITRIGHLTQDGIIKIISNSIPCNKIIQYIQLPSSDKTIVRQKHESYLVSDSQIQYYEIDYLTNRLHEPIITHNSLLLNGIDILSTFQDVVNHEMTAGTWYNHMTDTSNINSKLVDVKISIENAINSLFNNGIYIILIIFSLVISTLILFIIIKIIGFKKQSMQDRKKQRKPMKIVSFESKPLTARPVNEVFDEIFDSNMSLYSIRKDLK